MKEKKRADEKNLEKFLKMLRQEDKIHPVLRRAPAAKTAGAGI